LDIEEASEEAPPVGEEIVEEIPLEEAPPVVEEVVEEIPLEEAPPIEEVFILPEEEAAPVVKPLTPTPPPSALSEDEMMAEPPAEIFKPAPVASIPTPPSSGPVRAAPRSMHIPQPTPGTVVAMLPPVLSATIVHTVAEGEDLHWLAARYYGNARLWNKIYEANHDKFINPSTLTVGQRLQIPPL